MKKVFLSVFALLMTIDPAGAQDYQQKRQEILQSEQNLSRPAADLTETARFNALLDLYFDYTMLEYPEFATFVGYPAGQDRWTDNSMDAIERRQDDTRRALAIIRSIDAGQLDEATRLNHTLYLNQLEQQAEGYRFPDHLMPVTQLNGIHQDPAQLLSLMPLKSATDMENVIRRLDGLATSISQAVKLLRAGLDAGVTPPAVTLRDVPAQIENLLEKQPLDSALLASLKTRPDTIDPRAWKTLQKKARRIYRKSIVPAYRTLQRFLVEDYLPGARQSIAATALPDGAAWYEYRVRQMTTTRLSAQEIHELGQSEVKRIRSEMDKVIASTGFSGSFAEFTEFLRTDPQFYFTSADELITAYRDISKRADAATIKVIGKLPRLPYGVEPIPDFIAPSQTTAYYQPGSLEAGRAGIYFANTYNLQSRPSWEMEALSLHEAVPGHHLQLSLQEEIDMPWFRRYGGETAFVEGWGLYSESLGEEMGFYQDPYSKFGQLTYEMWRAVRLVVDTGMHALGWSRDDAIEFFKNNASKTEHDIVVEIDRYIAWPAQALAYKIGELKIKELRARAIGALGGNFDLRAFHDAILANGAIPLNVLERKIDGWIVDQKQN